MENKKTVATGGASLLDILLVVFIVLKLCGVITWSWWLVLLPLWIELGLIILVFGIVGIILVDLANEDKIERKRR